MSVRFCWWRAFAFHVCKDHAGQPGGSLSRNELYWFQSCRRMSFFRSGIIRTEKLYKIAAVLTIKIKKYLCTRLPPPPPPMAVPLRASKCSKFGKVWLWIQLPHNTWSLISKTRKHTLFSQSTFFIIASFFRFMSKSALSRLQRHLWLFLFPFEKTSD